MFSFLNKIKLDVAIQKILHIVTTNYTHALYYIGPDCYSKDMCYYSVQNCHIEGPDSNLDSAMAYLQCTQRHGL